MNWLENNISVLGQNPGHHISPLDREMLKYEYLGEDDIAALYQDKNNNYFAVNTGDCDTDNLPNPQKRELYFILGIASVEEIQQLIQNANPNTHFIIIEPENSFFASVLQYKDLSFFGKASVQLLLQPIEKLPPLLDKLFSTKLIFLSGNIRIYGTYYYRHYDVATYRKLVSMIGTFVKYKFFTFGNSIEDSLLGLQHNLENFPAIASSGDLRQLKGAFAGQPAFIVAAGPSLEKNIQELKKIGNKGIILAVDTIVQRLLKEEIVPDYIFSIERDEEVYTYFYKDKYIPPEVTLVAPGVVEPAIFREFRGNHIIPLRHDVREYYWLDEKVLKLGEDAFLSMGISVAHIAFGFAVHLGAAPVVLVGQDLAFSADRTKTHSSGTIYDSQTKANLSNEKEVEVEGYYGAPVISSTGWLDFKKWFEIQIFTNSLFVINATEGGVHIDYTEQLPLQEVISKYCKDDIDKDIIHNCPQYRLDMEEMYQNLYNAVRELRKVKLLARNLKMSLEKIELRPHMTENELMEIIAKMKKTDKLLFSVYNNNLLFHNLQSALIYTFQKFYKIPEVLTKETVAENIRIQIGLAETIINVLDRLFEVFEKYKPELMTPPKKRGKR